MKENRKNSKKIIENDEKAKKEIAKASKFQFIREPRAEPNYLELCRNDYH